ncbi:aspartate/glutamate racemase family protein [Bradyrhizobium sp. B117]|uniref:aspartate/glutamate racemase family protein n=1 Tax=Bradyrhizobium sp. B117 TaxID=3140246 RepID=UPI0031840C8A
MTQSGGALGILQLQNTPQTMYGSLSHPATFPFPTISRPVLGAWTKNVVFGGEDSKLEAAYISTAKDLVREGAIAITSNCGFTLKFQRAMTAALSVPVSMSSLLLLPYLIATIKGRIGILTFDSRPLTPDLLKLAGVRSSERVAVAGIENSETWRVMSEPENNYTVEQLTKDVLSAIAAMRKRYDDIEAILFECAGFPIAARQVREQTKLPVFDAVTNARLLMSGRNMAAPKSI